MKTRFSILKEKFRNILYFGDGRINENPRSLEEQKEINEYLRIVQEQIKADVVPFFDSNRTPERPTVEELKPSCNKLEDKKITEDNKLIILKESSDNNIVNAYKPSKLIYLASGIKGIPKADLNFVHELIHITSLIDLVEHMKKYKQLPPDANLAIIPVEKYGPDVLIYSKNLNINLTAQLKYRDVAQFGVQNQINLQTFCIHYKQTDFIMVLVEMEKLSEQLEAVNGMHIVGGDKLLFMNANLHELEIAHINAAFSSTSDDNNILKNFYDNKDEWANATVIHNPIKHFKVDEKHSKKLDALYFNTKKNVGEDKSEFLDKIILELINLAAKNEYKHYTYLNMPKHDLARLRVPNNFTNTDIYASIRKVEYMKQHGIEPTFANYILASALGVFKDK